MILKRSVLKDALQGVGEFKDDRLFITPLLSAISDRNLGNASVDLRLGRWFLTLQQSSRTQLDFFEPKKNQEKSLGRNDFIRFDSYYVLHPGRFVLGSTLEWIRMPTICAGSIVGKSSLGRHGLIIETAPVVHPAFSGSLTLELANVGEVPIALRPGMEIAQLQVMRAEGEGQDTGRFKGYRRPTLGSVSTDPIQQRLIRGRYSPL
ncbi:MAG: dCTP deaminase [Mesorhizobium sp.]|nr:MAG: dCTP deaminase [Mesorhizobium sp.]